MEKETFKYIWKQGIAKSAQDVFDGIDPGLRKEYSVSIDISDAMCERLYYQYDEVRCLVREKYFDIGQNGENRIDGHKICACITASLLNVRMINYEAAAKEIPMKVVYANYEVAFLSAIYVMYLFLLSDFERDGKKKCYDELKKTGYVCISRNQYRARYICTGTCKTLALNDLCGNDFDILTYADMLFWIEWYNKEQIYNKLL